MFLYMGLLTTLGRSELLHICRIGGSKVETLFPVDEVRGYGLLIQKMISEVCLEERDML